jgi:hypothetical protein
VRQLRRLLSEVSAFGAGAVTVTAVAYALERRHRAFIALFAVGCALSSAYGFAIGSVPFGTVEALWSIIALRRFAAPAGHTGTHCGVDVARP